MKQVVLSISLIAALFVPAFARAEEKEPAQDASYWMKRKLELSQDILEGLAVADYDKISEAARTMDKLNTIERFIRGRNDTYRAQLDIFRYSNAALIKNAEKENLDGAALAFNQMTLSCVNCHRNLRESNK